MQIKAWYPEKFINDTQEELLDYYKDKFSAFYYHHLKNPIAIVGFIECCTMAINEVKK